MSQLPEAKQAAIIHDLKIMSDEQVRAKLVELGANEAEGFDR